MWCQKRNWRGLSRHRRRCHEEVPLSRETLEASYTFSNCRPSAGGTFPDVVRTKSKHLPWKRVSFWFFCFDTLLVSYLKKEKHNTYVLQQYFASHNYKICMFISDLHVPIGTYLQSRERDRAKKIRTPTFYSESLEGKRYSRFCVLSQL